MAISQHGTSVLFTSHPKDGLVVNLYIPQNRRMPLQPEEALGPIYIPRDSRGVSIFKETACEKLSVRREKRKLSLFYDIVSGQSPDYLQDLLPITVGQTNNYNLRNSKNFTIPPGRLSLYQSSFFPSTIRLWNNLPTDLRNSPCQQMFKNEIRKVYDMPDKPPLYFSTGIIIANILHARLRKKCSSLKCDLFRCNLIASCNCDCGNYIESVDHFF